MAAARKQTPLKNTKRHVVKLAENAFRELGMAGTLSSRADEDRLWRLWRGMQFLDDDQAMVRGTLEELLTAWDKSKGTKKDVAALVEGLRKLATHPPGFEPAAEAPTPIELTSRIASIPKRDAPAP